MLGWCRGTGVVGMVQAQVYGARGWVGSVSRCTLPQQQASHNKHLQVLKTRFLTVSHVIAGIDEKGFSVCFAVEGVGLRVSG